jgi:hypothetical protein
LFSCSLSFLFQGRFSFLLSVYPGHFSCSFISFFSLTLRPSLSSSLSLPNTHTHTNTHEHTLFIPHTLLSIPLHLITFNPFPFNTLTN